MANQEGQGVAEICPSGNVPDCHEGLRTQKQQEIGERNISGKQQESLRLDTLQVIGIEESFEKSSEWEEGQLQSEKKSILDGWIFGPRQQEILFDIDFKPEPFRKRLKQNSIAFPFFCWVFLIIFAHLLLKVEPIRYERPIPIAENTTRNFEDSRKAIRSIFTGH